MDNDANPLRNIVIKQLCVQSEASSALLQQGKGTKCHIYPQQKLYA